MEVPDYSGENGEQKESMTFGSGHVPSHPPVTDLDGLPPSLASEMVSVVFLVYQILPITAPLFYSSSTAPDLSGSETPTKSEPMNPNQLQVVLWLGVCNISMASLLACLPEAQQVFLLL